MTPSEVFLTCTFFYVLGIFISAVAIDNLIYSTFSERLVLVVLWPLTFVVSFTIGIIRLTNRIPFKISLKRCKK